MHQFRPFYNTITHRLRSGRDRLLRSLTQA